jgi:hypothetical protein
MDLFKMKQVTKNAFKLSGIPKQFEGVPYGDFLSELSLKRRVQRYIEVGVEDGIVLSKIHSNSAIGVDPAFTIKSNVTANKKNIFLHQITSDEFFQKKEYLEPLGGPPDMVFLDGFHTFEFLLRDFYNAETICSSSGLIFLHDCLPLNSAMAERDMKLSLSLGATSGYPGYWTGDVWKIVPILKKYRPDLRIMFLDCPPTGLVCITNLDPRSNVLRDSYLDIVEEFAIIANDQANISSMYKTITLTSSVTILNSFDNTLYFKT